jgi:hypothetical protein
MDTRSGALHRRWLRRVAWLSALWIAGVASISLVTLLLRALMRAAGL